MNMSRRVVCWEEVGDVPGVSDCAAVLICSLVNVLVPYEARQHMDL